MRSFLPALVAFLLSCPLPANEPLTWHASGSGGIVAAGPESSARAGIEMLRNGGNAIDGAVATVFNLAVSDYGMFCIGGEVPFMFYNTQTGRVTVFNGMGGAPRDPETIAWYYAHGIPHRGLNAATVPSAISTLLAALELHGTRSLEQVLTPTLALLDSGKEPWHPRLAATLRRMVVTEKETAGSREEKIRAARDLFYKGDIAMELDRFYVEKGGLLRKADLEAHTTLVEDSVSASYRGYVVHKCNTWTQGPVLLQTLRLLESFDLSAMGFFSPDHVHTTVEAMKLAYADRDKYYGDPAFVKVPLQELLSDSYTRIRASLIDPNHASQKIRPGDPVRLIADAGPGESWPGEPGTTTCVVADQWGNVVAATPSANPGYGVCEELGIAHNTRLSSLNTQKGHPNCLEPGKRPRITLTPTLVLKEGKPILALSVAGGDMQDQVSLQLLLNFVEFGKMPKEAVAAPRFLTAHFEDSFNPSPEPQKRLGKIGGVTLNPSDSNPVAELTRRGHAVRTDMGFLAQPVMVYLDPATGTAHAASQPTHTFRGKCCAALERDK
jgi:gamma-glutamyltranspeptidase/glutathione hydrolase